MPDGITDLELRLLRAYVRRLYGHRCVRCAKPKARVVHEIEPRSQRPKDWYELSNMIVLCASCHEHIHMHGTANFADELRQCRDRALRLNS